MQKSPLRIYLLGGLLLVTGCVQYWEKPGGTQFEFDSTLSSCRLKAQSQFPPILETVLISPGYTIPGSTTCYPIGYMVNCNTSPSVYMPPRYDTDDRNRKNRDFAVDVCLMENGWRKAQRR
jgi:hypothetical protein